MIRVLLALLLTLATATAWAHKASDSFLILRPDARAASIGVRWDLALRDLQLVVLLDADGDGKITWGEVRARRDALFDYAFAHLALAADGAPCTPAADELLIDEHSDGAYAVLRFHARCAQPPRAIDLDYRALFEVDPTHRGLLRVDTADTAHSALLSPEQPRQHIVLDQSSALATFAQFVRDGTHHILIGYDHILFLLSLLLPAVLVRSDGAWRPVANLRTALTRVLAVVSAFTLAHSITLSLAALGLVGLPSRLVESAIALSIVVAALNNLRPRVTHRAWLLAFGFGLVHGFGFASVLADLGLPTAARALALIGFNLGVELGQMLIVLLVVPLIYLARRRAFYRPAVLYTGSCVIALVAGVWLCGRVFNLNLG